MRLKQKELNKEYYPANTAPKFKVLVILNGKYHATDTLENILNDTILYTVREACINFKPHMSACSYTINGDMVKIIKIEE